MISFFATLVFLREYIKNKFSNKDYHSIYRSFFCFLITIMCSLYSLNYWDQFVANPFYYDGYSYVINTIMIAYMIYDIVYFFYSYKFRYDLLFHHIISLIGFICYRKYFFITFCCVAEIISSMNWLYLINEKYTNGVKIFRGLSILLVRIPLWFNMFFLFLHLNKFISIGVVIFLFLDIFWLYIIYTNFKNNVNFVKYNKREPVELRKNIKNTVKNTFYSKRNKNIDTSDKINNVLFKLNKNKNKEDDVITNKDDILKHDLNDNLNDNISKESEIDKDFIDIQENKSNMIVKDLTENSSIKNKDNSTNKSYIKSNKKSSSSNYDNDSILNENSTFCNLSTEELFESVFKNVKIN